MKNMVRNLLIAASLLFVVAGAASAQTYYIPLVSKGFQAQFWQAVKALKGEKLPKTIDTGCYYYDKTNITDPKVAAVLYQ